MRQRVKWKRVLKKYPLVKDGRINEELVFFLYDTHGIPIDKSVEMIEEAVKELHIC